MGRRLLSSDQICILGILTRGPYAVSELSEVLGMPEGTLSKVVVLLERKGLVTDATQGGVVSITDDGRLVRWLLEQADLVASGKETPVRRILGGRPWEAVL